MRWCGAWKARGAPERRPSAAFCQLMYRACVGEDSTGWCSSMVVPADTAAGMAERTERTAGSHGTMSSTSPSDRPYVRRGLSACMPRAVDLCSSGGCALWPHGLQACLQALLKAGDQLQSAGGPSFVFAARSTGVSDHRIHVRWSQR